MYDPSCTSDAWGRVRGDAVRLKLKEDSLEGRAVRSFGVTASARGGAVVGDGEVGRLVGRRKEGVLRAYMFRSV